MQAIDKHCNKCVGLRKAKSKKQNIQSFMVSMKTRPSWMNDNNKEINSL